MSIIKDKKQRQKLVGFRTNPQAISFLSLYCLANKTNKTRVMRSMLDVWIIQKKTGTDSEREMINKVIGFIKLQWIFYLENETKGKKMAFDDYLDLVQRELKWDHGLKEEYISKIMKGLKNDTSKQTKQSDEEESN